LGSAREVSCNREHHNVCGHVEYLVIGIQEGGEGDIPSSLLLRLGVVGLESVLVCADCSHVEHLVGLGHGGRGGGEGGV
jgi:hypothetical protein